MSTNVMSTKRRMWELISLILVIAGMACFLYGAALYSLAYCVAALVLFALAGITIRVAYAPPGDKPEEQSHV